ncbi:MAG: extradiol ring-cleavage dioxygenase [Beijerinckiaceae bacterium]|nr:extradiol ring-cleavage dioxygenase [Beijerinckiaceae bacterium]
MAKIVAGIGVPHTPMFPDLVARRPLSEVAVLFAEVERRVAAARPDVMIVFDSDHLNTFFFDNMPTFCIGAAEQTSGPNDLTKMPQYDVPISTGLAHHIYEHLVGEGFDLSLTEEFEIDHSILVPLHFITPKMNVPIVPIFINGLAPPIPRAKRCYALGQAVRAAVTAWPREVRVAVLASGSFSLEIGGPRISHGQRSGVPDPAWAQHVQDLMMAGKINELLEEATTGRMQAAGNIGGELLNWIAMLGAIGPRKPKFMEAQLDHGHAFGVWRWDLP